MTDQTTYLGEEDGHDPRYYLETHADINAYVESQARTETRSYTAVPLNKEFGSILSNILLVTPRHFSSNKPWVYTIVVASTFLFTSIVFGVFTRSGRSGTAAEGANFWYLGRQ
jgi:hypothetical protein